MTTLSALQRTFYRVSPDSLCGGCIVDTQTMAEGATDIIGFNLTPMKNQYDITVSTSSWTQEGGAVSISSPSSTVITTQVTASADSPGKSRLKNTITMSDGQAFVRFVDVTVIKVSTGKDYP